jgi:hypothetical protein
MPMTSVSSLPLPDDIAKARQLAKWLDTVWTVPFLNKRIGLDPLLSLIPYAGSIVSGGLSVYLLFLAYRHQLPSLVMLRMLGNILVDVTVGELPFVGLLLDAMWRSNTMNAQLLEKAYHNKQRNVVVVDPT